ncbi:MAG TPA: heavy metal translocating P-type ATPase, partial [Lysobacter sp.]
EEALLTGESHPVEKRPGDTVLAGTVCRDRPARLRLTHTGAATRLSQLARLVEQAQSHRPAIAQSAHRVASRFVVGLLVAALAVYLGWRWYDPARAFEVTLALLVISCPCALSLSVPTALAAAHGALARLGVLAVRADALDRLAATTDVVFDKTGTLSEGRLGLRACRTLGGFDDARALAIAAALERDSTHPIAAAFAPYDRGDAADDVRAIAGEGVEGRVDGTLWRLGRADFAAQVADEGGVWLGDGQRAFAHFSLDERTRPDAATAVDGLQARGLAVHIASGDAHGAVDRFAHALGVAHAHARLAPEDKLALVGTLQRDGRAVAMVGDGLNDAPVLAGANVSLSIGGGAALAQRAADFVLTGRSLNRVPQAIDLARRTRRIIRQNLGWATAYNVVAIPLAAAGLVTPWVAALGMAVSSLIVTGNALRLTLVRPA